MSQRVIRIPSIAKMSQKSPAPPAAQHSALILSEVEAMRATVLAERLSGRAIGVVPTMGAIHEGHLSLVDASVAENDVTVATVFLNPLQFGSAQDWDNYPRAIEDDVALLAERRCDFIFVPAVDEMYRPGFDTHVEVGTTAAPLEGAKRPGHFRGVATVVLKLLQIVPADRAYFGQKDYQQTLVVKQMVRDFNIPVAIRVCPTVREADGLAMSSRNRLLDDAHRQRALSLSHSLSLAQQLYAAGERSAATIRQQMEAVIHAAGDVRIEYISFLANDTVNEVDTLEGPAVIAIAAQVGNVRLIDNCLLGESRS